METKRLFELNSFNTNNHEIEKNFRETCSWYESKFSTPDQASSQAYQKYINNYHKAKSLYLIIEESSNATQLTIYDTESEKEEIKILNIPIALNSNACITPLPNGELFCFCRSSNQDKAFIVDKNYEARLLPSGLPLFNSSAIYFNANIYSFGGEDKFCKLKTVSRKFYLNENRWINLTPMPQWDYYCHSVIFNGNILICGYFCENLLLYSVNIDSFSTIPYKFLNFKRKILINAERLYLIECFGWIYESESENEFAWKKISTSIISYNFPIQIYCLGNKEGIYISVKSSEEKYFKFDLKQMNMIKF